MDNPKSNYELDILRTLEKLTEEVNRIVSERGRSVFKRYPVTFAILVLFGVVSVSEATKGILKQVGVLEINPWLLLLLGLFILVLTGKLYKKLDK